MKLKLTIVVVPFLFFTFSCKKKVGSAGSDGVDGLQSLIDMQNFTSNSSCPTGGLIIKTGIDKNKNNVLDADEVQNTKYVCNGQGTALDKLIILPINFGANTTNTTPLIGGELAKFNKNNYPQVDSIILVANPYVGDAGNTVTLDLYNITDNTLINNSSITTNNLYGTGYLSSNNVYNMLPTHDITLGCSIKSGNSGMFAGSGYCYLYLYRH